MEDLSVEHALAAAFSHSSLNDLNQADIVGPPYNERDRKEKLGFAKDTLSQLFALSESFSFVFDLVVHSVFVRPSKPGKTSLGAHGGSSSAAIGSIWLEVGSKITALDLTEMFIHELAHQLVFIDELNHTQFNYSLIVKPENFARSAILKRNRPLDKTVHSIVVGAYLVQARNEFLNSHCATLIHPTTESLKQDTLDSIESVQGLTNLNELITPHTRRFIEESAVMCRAVP